MSPNNKPPLKLLAWNGIALKVPVTWEIDSLDKDHMLIGEEGQPRVEIKWTDAPKKFTLEKYLKKFVSQSQKQLGIKIYEESMPKQFSHPRNHFEFFFFSWESRTSSGKGLLIFCSTCGRLTIIRFFSADGSISKTVQESVIASFNDHPEHDQTRWHVFGMEFLSPDDFTLHSYSFKPGAYHLALRRGKTTLEVFSWGPARFLLSNTTLQDFTARHQPRIKGFAEAGFCHRGSFLEWKFRTQRFKNAEIIPFLNRFSLFSIFRICHDTAQNRILGVLVDSPVQFENDIIKRSIIGDI